MPPATFLPCFGTISGSPAAPQVEANGSLSDESWLGGGAAVVWNDTGALDSFSTQEPFGMKTALLPTQADCDSMWVRPSVPGRKNFLLASSSRPDTAVLTASALKALGSRLSIAFSTS